MAEDTPQFVSPAPYWYNVGVWGQRGFGVPYFHKGHLGRTFNLDIEAFTTEAARRLQGIMLRPDATRVDPPERTTVELIVQLINRSRKLVAGRAIAENEKRYEAGKVGEGRAPFSVFPCPLFLVRSRLLKNFCKASFAAISELFESTENVFDAYVSNVLAESALRPIRRFETNLAQDYFGMSKVESEAPDIDLSTKFEQYSPLAQGMLSGEAYDTTGDLSSPSALDLGPLAQGILMQDLPPMTPWPSDDVSGTGGSAVSAGSGAASGGGAQPYVQP